jgi:hypothetical protein
MAERVTGRCLCGAVTFEAMVEDPAADACHCDACRRWSGHVWASVNAAFDTLKLLSGADELAWYASSDVVRRGFCRRCGSSLFWHPDRHPEYAWMAGVAAGALDAPTGVRLTKHIFTSERGDYYPLDDGLPQRARF